MKTRAELRKYMREWRKKNANYSRDYMARYRAGIANPVPRNRASVKILGVLVYTENLGGFYK